MTLNTLAPDIVESLRRSDRADSLSLDKLTLTLPVLWGEQRELFGFPPA